MASKQDNLCIYVEWYRIEQREEEDEIDHYKSASNITVSDL